MARLLVAAFEQLGHEVVVASEMRSFMRMPDMDEALQTNISQAEQEIARIVAEHGEAARPDLWFTYHPYYKAPDLIGPNVARRLGIPLINAEASYSHRRNIDAWETSQSLLLDSLRLAAVNLCFTRRDHDGLRAAAGDARLAMITPFIDAAQYLRNQPSPHPNRLVTIAMMRPGDKLSSYRALATSLGLIADRPWTLSIAGDGECRSEVEALFAPFGSDRIEWLGSLAQPEIAALLSRGSIFVWPGHGEAYGLAYLEAQAAGLPVVAEAVAGVPEVVETGKTGILTDAGDPSAFAAAIASLLNDNDLRMRLGQQARQFVEDERSIAGAAAKLGHILDSYIG